MDTMVAHLMAQEMLKTHLGNFGAIDIVWTNSKGTFGSFCERVQIDWLTGQRRVVGRRLHMSRPLVKCNSLERVRKMILHEIAHGLAGVQAGHGARWQQACAQVGIPGEKQCFDSSDTVTPPARWQSTCPACGRVYKMQSIRSSRRMHGSRCRCPAAAPLTWVDGRAKVST